MNQMLWYYIVLMMNNIKKKNVFTLELSNKIKIF